MHKNSPYFQNLIKEVIDNSDSNDWNTAVLEWEISDVEEDLSLSQSCICGHPNLRYLFTIQNKCNGNILFPIGSECIKKFNRDELYEEASILEKLFKLYHAVEHNEKLKLSSEFFSRKLLLYLYEHGAFKATQFNDYVPRKDYQFMLDMFNKRERSERQENKTIAIILNSIKPYLQEQIKNKIRG